MQNEDKTLCQEQFKREFYTDSDLLLCVSKRAKRFVPMVFLYLRKTLGLLVGWIDRLTSFQERQGNFRNFNARHRTLTLQGPAPPHTLGGARHLPNFVMEGSMEIQGGWGGWRQSDALVLVACMCRQWAC
jgi:hypothetical protein